MTLLFDEMQAAVDEAEVLPMEFVSLDAPSESQVSTTSRDAHWQEMVAALELKLVSEMETNRLKAEEVRREAEQETAARMRDECERRVVQERELVAKLAKEFAEQRTNYFAEVEGEIVSLALAIAERVLEREASMAPLLLRAVVRVALDKVAGESNVRLHVPEKDTGAWQEVFAEERYSASISVVGEENMRAGEAVLETGVGRVDLGVHVQLKEVERGFFDLLQKRPAW